MSKNLRDMLGQAAMQKKRANTAHKSAGKKGSSLFTRLSNLYSRMEAAYNENAISAGLTCAGCETNCCNSFFQHHTYVEWAYLWRGLQELSNTRCKAIVTRAERYVEDARQSLALDVRPSLMCPLNEEGLCVLYPYRLMICRMHGTRNSFTLPNGSERLFPGCTRFTSLPAGSADSDFPSLDRTPFYNELAILELEFLKKAGKPLPRVDMTLAEMIVLGPPKIR